MAAAADAAPAHHIECTICLEYVQPDEEKLVTLDTCGHAFHEKCIRAWFHSGLNSLSNKPCPHCREPASERNIKNLYIALVQDETSKEISAELETVRKQLQKEKEKKSLGSKDEDALANLIVQTAGMRIRETATGQRTPFMPNSRHVLFEGCTGVEDRIVFRSHGGQKHWQHEKYECFLPELEITPSLGRDTIHNSLLQTIFKQQMHLVRNTYDEEIDGRLELTVKFGLLYVFKKPFRSDSMLVRDFNFGIGVQGNKREANKVVSTSVIATESSIHVLESALQRMGYSETGNEEFFVINVDHQKEQPRISYEVYLDRNFKFHSMRHNDRGFINLDICRKDRSRPDVRLALKGVHEKFKQDELHVMQRPYSRDNLVTWDSTHDKLLIARFVIGKVSYARHKKVRDFAAPIRASKLQSHLTVKVIETTAFGSPQFNGTFKYKKSQTEVFVRISGKEKVFEACDQDNMIQELLSFSDELIA